MKNILFCGDREWRDFKKIRYVFEKLYKKLGKFVVIHGAARGADDMCGEVASEFGLKVIPIPADWKKHGLAAGPIRNNKMLDLKPDFVIAFHSNITKSKGTKHCVTEAYKRYIKVAIIK